MLKIIRTTSDHPDFRSLVILLDQDLLQRYQDVQAEYDKHNKIEQNNTVVVAYWSEMPVGCGCFKPFGGDTVEIKRMFVKSELRGKGIATKILAALCTWAYELQFRKAVLETAARQPEAIHLYKKAGFEVIPNYPPYTTMELSMCMQKHLAGPIVS